MDAALTARDGQFNSREHDDAEFFSHSFGFVDSVTCVVIRYGNCIKTTVKRCLNNLSRI